MAAKIRRWLGSPWFFAVILALFFVEAVWIAVSAAYPMVFDENVHFGVIRLYSHQWSPFFPADSTHLEPFGALARDPSILYRYLMSFPYRLISALTNDLMIQVVALRLINVAVVGGALVLYRRLLLKTRVSAAAVHGALLFLVLIPVLPLLAGQINYDSLVMLMTAWTLLAAVAVGENLSRQRRLPVGSILLLVALCLAGSLVQYEFLPVLAGVVAWLAWRIWRQWRAGRLKLPGRRQWRQTAWRRRAAVGLPLIVFGVMFFKLYAVNVWLYHTPTPNCGQVLTAAQCAGNENWLRTRQALAHKGHVDANPLIFAAGWTYRMFVGLFYTSSGGAGPRAWYLSVNPLPVPFVTALALAGAGGLLFVRYWRDILARHKELGFLLFMALFYVGVLWLRNYQDFLYYGQKFAINGRYLLPVAPILIVVLVLAFQKLLANKERLKLAFWGVVLLLFLQGGGALTYVAVSNPDWYWPNRAVIRLNKTAQTVVRPLIPFKTPLPPLSGV